MQIVNKKAKFNYQILEKYEAGIVLSGSEAKSVSLGKMDISNSFVKIIDNEAFLINASIPIEGKVNYSATRTRKLLLHKDEITTLLSKIKAKRLTLVPLRVYNKNRIFKVEIGLAKAKRKFEKRQEIKKRDIQREIEKELKKNLV